MSPLSFPALSMAQVVHMDITHDNRGWLVAKSDALPGRICAARDEDSLAARIEETIHRWYAEDGTAIRVTRPRGRNDLAIWHVEEVGAD